MQYLDVQANFSVPSNLLRLCPLWLAVIIDIGALLDYYCYVGWVSAGRREGHVSMPREAHSSVALVSD